MGEENPEFDFTEKYLGDKIGSKGITLEICAGLIDKKDKSALEIAMEEVEEECGYKVQPDQMEFVHKYYDLGCTRTLFYAEVTDDQKISDGGGLEEENEMIEVVEMSIDEFRKYLNQEELQTDGAKLHGVYWFLANKARYLENS